jgi:hypothetical protein
MFELPTSGYFYMDAGIPQQYSVKIFELNKQDLYQTRPDLLTSASMAGVWRMPWW